MDFKSEFRSVDVLMVNDLQFIAGKDSTQEEFFTFNALIDQNKQIIISADRAPTEIRIWRTGSKAACSAELLVDLHPTDYELVWASCSKKAEFYRAQYRDLVIVPGVLEFLAHRITTNVRVLEGALTRLFAFASLVGREINLDLTQDCLADILRASDRRLTIEEIQRKVAEHYNVRLADIVGPKRMRCPAAAGDVSGKASDLASLARNRPKVWRARPHHDHSWRSQD